jgi:hypothetical protein
MFRRGAELRASMRTRLDFEMSQADKTWRESE